MEPIYALETDGLTRSSLEYTSMEEIAADYVREIRAVQPNGPYFVGGYCFGGLVTFEIAQQLSARGEQVALSMLLSIVAPDYDRAAIAQGTWRLHLETMKHLGMADLFNMFTGCTADKERLVLHEGRECKLGEVAAGLAGSFTDVLDAGGRPEVVTIRAGTGRVRVAEAAVVLHRPARHNTGEKTAGGNKKQVEVPGPPLPLRLVVTRVVDEAGTVLAEWWLLTNVAGEDADAATIGRWYAWRWAIESYHKLLKSAGMNAEAWQQETGAAFLRRLCVASMACLTVWHLQRDESPAAARLRVHPGSAVGAADEASGRVDGPGPAGGAGAVAGDRRPDADGRDWGNPRPGPSPTPPPLPRSLRMAQSKSCVHTYAPCGGGPGWGVVTREGPRPGAKAPFIGPSIHRGRRLSGSSGRRSGRRTRPR